MNFLNLRLLILLALIAAPLTYLQAQETGEAGVGDEGVAETAEATEEPAEEEVVEPDRVVEFQQLHSAIASSVAESWYILARDDGTTGEALVLMTRVGGGLLLLPPVKNGLILLAAADSWLDFRRRLAAQSK